MPQTPQTPPLPQETSSQSSSVQQPPTSATSPELSLPQALEKDLLDTLKACRKVRKVILNNLESLNVRLLSLNNATDKAAALSEVAGILNTLTRTAETSAKSLKLCAPPQVEQSLAKQQSVISELTEDDPFSSIA